MKMMTTESTLTVTITEDELKKIVAEYWRGYSQGWIWAYRDLKEILEQHGFNLDILIEPGNRTRPTGMKDKNGNIIFEGDTIKFVGGYALGYWTGVVSYDDSSAGFVASGTRERYSNLDPGTFKKPLCEINKSTIEIIHSEGRIENGN